MDILYADKRILVAVKPCGVLSTNEPGGMPELLREALGEPEACVRTVHRLDQAVGGLMVFARSREADRRLSGQMAARQFRKEYLAVSHGTPAAPEGSLRDLLYRDKQRRMTLVAEGPGPEVKEARLDYRRLAMEDGLCLLSIRLHTGRTHQIRVQLSHAGLPIAGDRKYGLPDDYERIALWSHRLAFTHPETGEEMTFTAPMPDWAPWDRFRQEEVFVDKG